MTPEMIENRDKSILEHIRDYCTDSNKALDSLAPTKDIFLKDRVCQNSVAMCVMQIGELVKHLSFGFTEQYTEIPWHNVARTRDLYAHHYTAVDPVILYETATEDLPVLLDFCNHLLS